MKIKIYNDTFYLSKHCSNAHCNKNMNSIIEINFLMFIIRINHSFLFSYQEQRCIIAASFKFNQVICIFFMLRTMMRLYFLEL